MKMSEKNLMVCVKFAEFQLKMIDTICEAYGYQRTTLIRMLVNNELNGMYEKSLEFLKKGEIANE